MVWRDIKEYVGLYQISNTGIVKSRRKILTPHPNTNGYPEVVLYNGGNRKHKLIHRLLYSSFISDIPDGMFVNHIDNNRANFQLGNLELVTPSENNLHAYRSKSRIAETGEKWHRSKLKNSQVLEILQLSKSGLTQSSIANRYGISQVTVNNILSGYRWSALTGRTS